MSGKRKWSIAAVASVTAFVVAGAGILAAVDGIEAAQSTTGPIARYDMRAGTTSGLGAMGGGMKGGFGMAMGGGGGRGPLHELWLELGSTTASQGQAPKGDHFMPAGVRLGPSVPLRTPEPVKSSPPSLPGEREFQRPRGRMLIFWGCGEHAPAGQPVVIDFAKVAAGQMPADLWSTQVPLDRWVSPTTSRTYGVWPNTDDRKTLSPDSALPGAHRVVANYAPDMNFNLTHDFMAPLRVTSQGQPSGAIIMQWSPLADATGYYASLMGGKGSGGGQVEDLVWWTSSASREFGGGLSDWLSPATVAPLVAGRTVLPPQASTCTIPAEVHAAAPNFMMTTMIAYGPEESFAYPPRPTDPRAVWHIQWEARIRHRSMTSFMPGMPGMNGMDDGDSRQRKSDQPCQPRKKRGFGGLGGLIGGALGSGDGC
ncbi:hypothetical protein [Novosphingobium nitrogenifigens]|uniref:hypothetical protein n=1 Tax=Novosphingobium nitrogenifigens TaxID=378548 RepID=UPI000AA7F440|nr:hypothetical protein [Novosphingobium nitrogenifigens]